MGSAKNFQDLIDNFQVKPKNQASFLVKWRWKYDMRKSAYFQITNSYREMNETKTIYSPFIPGESSPSYTINNVQTNKNYEICLKVFVRNISSVNVLARSNLIKAPNQSPILNPDRVCVISMTTTSHLQAIISCLIGVFIALILLGVVMVLYRSYKKWLRRKSVKICPPGSNHDYYDRHRNSETNTTPTEDLSGFDDCDVSCTSQMIADGLAWSPSSSLDSRYSLSVIKTKSALQNHSSSHPSSTPRILEEDGFYDCFVEKTPEHADGDKATSNRAPESVKAQRILSPFFSTTSCSTLNSFGCDYQHLADNGAVDGTTISNNQAISDEMKQNNNYSDSTKSSTTNLTLQLIDDV